MTDRRASRPTNELYDSFQFAYDYFNRRLFDDRLPEIIFTFQRKAGAMGFFAPKRWGNLNGRECHEIAMNPSYIANSRLIEVMKTLVHEMCHCWQYAFGSPGRHYYHNKEWAMKMIKIGLMPSSTGEPGGEITGQHMSDYIIEDGLFINIFGQLKNEEHFQLRWIDKLALPRLYEPVIAPIDSPSCSSAFRSPLAVNVMTIDPDTRQKEEKVIKAFTLDEHEPTYLDERPDFFFEQKTPPRKTRNRYVCGCGNRIYGKPNLEITCKVCGQDFEWREYQNKNDPE